MTNRDIMIQILSEAGGIPAAEIRQTCEMIYKTIEVKTDIDAEVPADQVAGLLSSLRAELPGIRQWLIVRGIIVARDVFGQGGAQ